MRNWRTARGPEKKERIAIAIDNFIEELLAANLESEIKSTPESEPVTDTKKEPKSRSKSREGKDWAEVEKVVSKLEKW